MHCHIFSEGVTVADACPCRATLPLQVLSLDADGGEWEKLVAAANLGVTIYNDVRMQPGRLAKGDVPADDTVRTDFTIVANGCIRLAWVWAPSAWAACWKRKRLQDWEKVTCRIIRRGQSM